MLSSPLHPAWKRHVIDSVLYWGLLCGLLLFPVAFALLPAVGRVAPVLLLGWAVAIYAAGLRYLRFACPACGSRFYLQLARAFSTECHWCALPKWADPSGWPVPASVTVGASDPPAPSRDRILLAEVALEAGALAGPVAPAARSFRPDLVLPDGTRHQAILVNGPPRLAAGDRSCVEFHAVGEGDWRGFTPGEAFELQQGGRRLGTGRVRGWR